MELAVTDKGFLNLKKKSFFMALNSRNEHEQPFRHFGTDLFSEMSQSILIDNTLFFLFGAVALAAVAVVRAEKF